MKPKRPTRSSVIRTPYPISFLPTISNFAGLLTVSSVLKARLGTTSNGKIKHTPEGIQQVSELLNSFLQHQAEGVGTPKELALRMARLAHLIRNLIINTFSCGSRKRQFARPASRLPGKPDSRSIQ